jgi:phosphoribosyl-AMP cyclohydrolase
MVLPLLPVVDALDEVEKASGSLTKNGFRAIGQVMFRVDVNNHGKVLDSLSKLSTILDIVVDIEGLSIDQTIQLLDFGAAKVVVSKPQLGDLIDVPAERILVRLSEDQVAEPAIFESIANSVAGIIIDSSFALDIDPGSLKSVVTSLRKGYLPSGGERTVYVQYANAAPPPTIAQLKSFALLSIDPIIPSSCLTSSPKDNLALLSVAQIALLGAKTDRPDGLYSTVVVDERHHALGLVYSSAESITETIRTGTGVYQSRERGLWYKGATSGATQEILGISWDCDADCLRYTVKQAGKGISPLKLY